MQLHADPVPGLRQAARGNRGDPGGALALQGSTRVVLRHYSPQLLDNLVAITASASLLTYGLYTVDAETAALHGTEHLVLTLPS